MRPSPLPAALGWPVYIASLGGTIGLLATRFRQAAVVLAFPAAYYLVSGNLDTVFARYSLPLVPFLALNAGWLVVWLVRAVTPPQAAKVRVGLISVVSLALVAPSAIEVWRLGGILSRDDTRVEAVRTLMRIVAPGSSFYQSGGQFGRVPLDLPGQEVSVRELRFDEAAGIFTADGATNPILPDWIVIQRSPLVAYSYVPVTLEQVVRQHYRMTARIDSHDDRAGRVYDQQDAFFLPLSGLAGVSRVGPNIESTGGPRRTDELSLGYVARPGHSVLSAVLTSTRIARRAGTKLAMAAAASSVSIAASQATGSIGVMP